MSFFRPNITSKGRIFRAIIALLFLILTGISFYSSWPLWLSLLFLANTLFVAFESVKGWCVLRACGIQTKL